MSEQLTHTASNFIVPQRLEGEETDSPAIRRALDAVKNTGGTVYFCESEYLIDEPIVIYRDVSYIGRGRGQTTIRVKIGANCDAFITEHFMEFCNQKKYGENVDENYGPKSRMPQNFVLKGFTIDGNANFEETEIEHTFRCTGNTEGYGIRIFGKRYIVAEVQVQNIPQIGYYTEFNSGEIVTPANSFNYFIGTRIAVHVISTGEEGFVHRGPSDQRIDDLWVCSSCLTNKTTLYKDYENWELGSVIFEDKDPINGKLTYCASPELGFAHIWRGFNCWGMLVIGQLRFKADHIIIESTNGGIRNSKMTYSQINMLDIHDCRFGDSTRPYMHLRSKAHTKISNLEIRFSKENSHKDMILMDSDNVIISECLLRGNADILPEGEAGGDGVIINGNCNQILALHGMNIAGTNSRGEASTVCTVNGSHNVVRGVAYNCDVAVKVENPSNLIDITARHREGQISVCGPHADAADLHVLDYNADEKRYAEYPINVSLPTAIAADTTEPQEIILPLSCPITPSISNVQLTLQNPLKLSDFAIAYLSVVNVSDTALTVAVRLSSACVQKGATLGIGARIEGRCRPICH